MTGRSLNRLIGGQGTTLKGQSAAEELQCEKDRVTTLIGKYRISITESPSNYILQKY